MARAATPAIAPFFIVSSVDRTLAFYREKLGFEAMPGAERRREGSKPR